MIRYYELDPRILKSHHNWPLLLDVFGFQNGRLIVKPTFKEIKESSKSPFLTVEPLKPCFARSDCGTPGGVCRITLDGDSNSISLDGRTGEDGWETGRVKSVERKADCLADEVAPALSCERKIQLMDPYFDVRGGFLSVLTELVNRLDQCSCEREIVIHTKVRHEKGKRDCTHSSVGLRDEVADRVFAEVRSRLSKNWSVVVNCWACNTPFHNRYILGEAGGIGSCWGFNVDNRGPDTLFIMDSKLSRDIREQFETQNYAVSIRSQRTDKSLAATASGGPLAPPEQTPGPVHT